MADNPLTRHLDDIGESYAQHCGKAAGFGFKMIAGGLACLVHAVLPFLFERTGSEVVSDLHGKLAKRVEKPNWERHPII
jgi:hypothetical protein